MAELRIQVPSSSGGTLILTGETGSTPAGGNVIALHVVLCGIATDSGVMVPLAVESDSAGYGVLVTTT